MAGAQVCEQTLPVFQMKRQSQLMPSYLLATVLTLIIFCLSNLPTTNATQCTDIMHSKTRYFINLAYLANNTIGFDAANALHDGNYIAFTGKASPTGILYNNSFVTNTSEYIRKIDLYNQTLTNIIPGAFNSLFCLKYLDLSNNNLTKVIHQDIFIGLTYNLEELDLSFNQIEMVGNSTFASLIGLRKLNLSNNTLMFINSWTFFNNTLLLELSLQNNMLYKLDPTALDNIPHLQVLRLDHNQLDHLDVSAWTNSTHLTTLNISHNFLHTFDIGLNASFKKLAELDLGYNQLLKLNVAQMEAQLPQLVRIFLDGNPWFCDYLDSMMTLMRTRVDSYGFNTSLASRNGVACFDRFSTAAPPTSEPLTQPADVPYAPMVLSSVPTPSDAGSEDAPDSSSTGESSGTTEANHSNDNFGGIAMGLTSSIEQLQTTVTLLTVIIVAFAVVEIVIRTGLHRRLFKRTPGPLFDVNRTYNTESENLALLRS